MEKLRKNRGKAVILSMQFFFLLCLAFFYISPRRNFSWEGRQLNSGELFLQNFLESGTDGFYIDSSSEEKKGFVGTPEIELGPGVYEIRISYRSEGGRQKYILDAQNADFKLFQGNYHKELPAGKESYTTLIWNGKNLHNFRVECDYSGEGYILLSGIRIEERRSWVPPLGLACLFLFGVFDFFFLFRRERLERFLTERNRLIWGGCLFIVLFSSLPLFSGLLFYGHDLEFHLLRIEGVKEGLLSHQFPVRIQPNWMNGFGYGVSVFYGDFLLYVPAVLRLFGIGVQGAYKSYVFLINVLTTLIGFYSFRMFAKDDRIGLAGSFLFTGSVYRLNCIYVRAAVGEYTAMAFMPLYFYGIYAMLFRRKEKKRAWVCAALGFSGIFCSHMITSEIIVFITVIAAAVYYKRLMNREIWADIAKCALLIFGCTAWFLVPFLDLARDSYVFNMEGVKSTIQTWGTTWSQLLNPFPFGRGEALAYTMVERPGISSQFSYAVGMGFTAAVFYYFTVFAVPGGDRTSLQRRKCRHLLCWGFALAAASTTGFPWNTIQEKAGDLGFLISNIQFPWRLLGAVSLFLAFFCCALMEVAGEQEKRKAGQVLPIILFCALLSSGYFLADRINDNKTLYMQNQDDLDSFHVMGGEYIPAKAYMAGTWGNDISTSENVLTENTERKYNAFRVTCRTLDSDMAYIDFPLLYYRGYEAVYGGKDRDRAAANESGRVRVSLPAGYAGTVEVRYHAPGHWRMAEGVSALCIIYVLTKAGKGLRKK